MIVVPSPPAAVGLSARRLVMPEAARPQAGAEALEASSVVVEPLGDRPEAWDRGARQLGHDRGEVLTVGFHGGDQIIDVHVAQGRAVQGEAYPVVAWPAGQPTCGSADLRGRRRIGLREGLVEPGTQHVLRGGAGLALHDLAVVHDDQRGDALHREPPCCAR